MPYIGTQPTTGIFTELDALTASATADYALTLNGAAYNPATVNNLLVSINGVIQAGSTMSLSGSTLTVGATLSSSDVIDFVRVFGSVGTVSTPTDGSVTTAKLGNNAVTKAKIGTTELDLATIKDSTGTNTAITIDSDGRILQPAKPFFHVTESNNTDGTGMTGQIAFDTVVTDIGSHYNTAGFFKVPIAGLYHFSFSGFGCGTTSGGAVASGVDSFILMQKATADDFSAGLYTISNAYGYGTGAHYPNAAMSANVYLAANDRVRIFVSRQYLYASADADYDPHFSGFLIG
tara:strand:+ start:7 stop:879 length:873 start_codon:yes stop_codon:yes gene_type:complete